MPIYEFACPDCRKIFSFLSKRINPERVPACPKCGGGTLSREISVFSAPRGATESVPAPEGGDPSMPDMDSPQAMRAMAELERDMAHLDENNPRHMAHLMRKMKDIMPAGSVPKEMETAIKRLEAGEDPDKIEEDMGDVLAGFMGPEDPDGSPAGSAGSGGYSRDSGLYDF
jgi:putative FmdB family regulatory protein